MEKQYELRMTSKEAENILHDLLIKYEENSLNDIDHESIIDAISTLLYVYTKNESSKTKLVLEQIIDCIDNTPIPDWVTNEENAELYLKTVEMISDKIDDYLKNEKRYLDSTKLI